MHAMDSIKKSFSLSRQSWDMFGVFFLYGAIVNLVNLALSPRLQAPNPDPQALTITAVSSLVILLVGIFMQGGLMGYMRDRLKLGTANLGVFFSSGTKHYLRLFLFGLILFLLIAFGALLTALLAGAFAEGNLRILGIVLIIVVVAFVASLIISMFLAPYVIVNDGKKVFASIQQSWWLVRKNIVALLVMGLVLVLIGFVLGLITGVLLGLLGLAIKNPQATQIITAVVTGALNAYIGLLMTGAFTHFYLSVSNANNTAAA